MFLLLTFPCLHVGSVSQKGNTLALNGQLSPLLQGTQEIYRFRLRQEMLFHEEAAARALARSQHWQNDQPSTLSRVLPLFHDSFFYKVSKHEHIPLFNHESKITFPDKLSCLGDEPPPAISKTIPLK